MTTAEWRNPRRGYIASTRTYTPESRRRKLYKVRTGRGQASMVDTSIVIANIEPLRQMGFSCHAIGAAAGLPGQTVVDILNGVREKTRVDVASRLARVTHVPVPAQTGTLVPAIGARRRVCALNAIGWGRPEIGERLNVRGDQITGWINRPRIQYMTWAAIADVYNELSGTPGPSARSITWARNRGWVSPIAWEGRDIDHPDSVPDLGDDPQHTHVDDVLLARILRGEHDSEIPKPERVAVLDHAIKHEWSVRRTAACLNLKHDAAEAALLRRRRKLQQEAEVAA
ncbi:hypothetical protein ACFYY5_28985 [Nocardia elegans]|uniref:XRE family transcriptional regulator n=1 Tax=Nocardia elegans TaxID=300029 RepID=A0ABW6TL85_9NOCA